MSKAAFITENTELDLAEMKRAGFRSVVLPEYPSEEELAKVARLLQVTSLECWAQEFGNEPEQFGPANLRQSLIWTYERSYTNLLMKFGARELYIWAPEAHEYMVIFGDPSLVKDVVESRIFELDFDEYLQSGALSPATVEFLRDIRSRYTIP